MDFVYAPPPPAVANSDSSSGPRKMNNNKSTNNNIKKQSKGKIGVEHNTNRGKQNRNQINRDDNQSIIPESTQSNLINFNDLPTYLPNSGFLNINNHTPSDDSSKVELKIDQHKSNDNNENNNDKQDNNDISNDHENEHGIAKQNEIDDETIDDEAQALQKPGFIPGTTISLQTEEDIAKWIEERKKKWPTNSRVREKQANSSSNTSKSFNNNDTNENADKNNLQNKKRSNTPSNASNKKQKAVCRFFQQHKKCKFGTKCKNLHESTSSSLLSSNAHSHSSNTKIINGMLVIIPKRFNNDMYAKENSSSNPSLYKMLVQKELFEHENNLVIDFIQFLDDQNLIDHEVTL